MRGRHNDTRDACVRCQVARCGDGFVQRGVEQCDEGLANNDDQADACRTNCQRAACGDGVIDQGEACDDGEANSDQEPDACRSGCVLPACGDGVRTPERLVTTATRGCGRA